jgi:hypothetical protein
MLRKQLQGTGRNQSCSLGYLSYCSRASYRSTNIDLLVDNIVDVTVSCIPVLPSGQFPLQLEVQLNFQLLHQLTPDHRTPTLESHQSMAISIFKETHWQMN